MVQGLWPAPGKEVFVGIGVAGLAGEPQCRHGSDHASLATALSAGVGLGVTVFTRGGEVYFKFGGLSVSEPLMQLAISAAAKMLSAKDAWVCRDSDALTARVKGYLDDAVVSAGNGVRFTAEQLTSALQIAAAIASAIARGPCNLVNCDDQRWLVRPTRQPVSVSWSAN